jgi:hypothetical protein
MTQCNTPDVSRHSFAAAFRRSPATTPAPAPVELQEARPIDLLSLRLVLRQHLDELRSRGVDDQALRPIEDELRRYSEAVDHLTGGSPRL